MERDQKISGSALWAGRIMSGLIILFMLFDAVIKFLRPEPVIQATIHELGYKEYHILTHAFLSLIPTLLYCIPRTSVLGAVLLTALFGGAIASNMRVDNPLFSHVLFPVYAGILVWGGLWLRNKQLRAIFPITKP